MKTIFVAITVFILCTACSMFSDNATSLIPLETPQYLWQSPIAKPPFVKDFTITTNTDNGSASNLCINLLEGIIWEQGDTGSSIFLNILHNSQIIVDGLEANSNEVSFTQLTVGLSQIDQSGNTVGSHGGGVSICLNVENLAEGIHVEHIQFKSTSGKMFSYELSFKVLHMDSKVVINLPDALKQ